MLLLGNPNASCYMKQVFERFSMKNVQFLFTDGEINLDAFIDWTVVISKKGTT